MPNQEISELMSKERNFIISRAIISARNHGIALKPGSPNPGAGDCAFESVIQNNNERGCFLEKKTMSTSYYRKMWVIDMANRTVDTDWNIFSQQEWLAGWQEMLIPGTYERGIFGDLMLPGIACGIRKYLLIFNTHPQSPHDPIYVVDPRQFNIEPSTDIPIILGYNQSHYESLHPCTNADILASINLVTEYLENRYRFSKEDLSFLIGLNGNSSHDQEAEDGSCSFSKENLKSKYETKDNKRETADSVQPKISAPKGLNNAAPSPMKKSKRCQESLREQKTNQI